MGLAVRAFTLPTEGWTPQDIEYADWRRPAAAGPRRDTQRLHVAIAALQALALSVQHGSREGAPPPWIFDPDTHMLPRPTRPRPFRRWGDLRRSPSRKAETPGA